MTDRDKHHRHNSDDRCAGENVPVDEPSGQDLNRLYGAALEFGSDWRRPLPELADEQLADHPQEYRVGIAAVMEDCRRDIEKHIEDVHLQISGEWDRSALREIEAWICDRFPWMSKKNRDHAISQGKYYAWHDCG